MARPKGGPRLGGRQKGTSNARNENVMSNVINVFERIGGRDQMAIWAKENQTEFYKIYAKLLPQSMTADLSGEFILTIRK